MNSLLNMIRQQLVEKRPMLGRWGLKTCEEMKTKINSIYQNRDHCGDKICKKPERVEKYVTFFQKKSFKKKF